jgi:hypothetical protein
LPNITDALYAHQTIADSAGSARLVSAATMFSAKLLEQFKFPRYSALYRTLLQRLHCDTISNVEAIRT